MFLEKRLGLAWLRVLLDFFSENNLRDDFKRMVQVVIDCTGSTSRIEDALALVEPEGIIVSKTTIANRTGLDLSKVAVNEIKVIVLLNKFAFT
ncbi:MAG: hypothetical protein FH762_09125 [Firmicutes bacterium]|nr:hypothetical protein [Bacillota bacterium]